MDISTVLFAFSLTLIAGLATGIGGLISFTPFAKMKNFLAVSLGFSAGIMIFVSFIEIFPKALESLTEVYEENLALILTMLLFFIGVFLIMLIDYLIPSGINPHEMVNQPKQENKKLMRMGLFTALAITLHNFPEGLATFYAALVDVRLGITITIAIALHNIPEGIAVAVPIYQATKSRKKAFAISLLSGLAEPIGALIGFAIFSTFFPPELFGLIFALVAGIMVYISIDELLPTAEKYGHHHQAMLGFIFGMLVMAISIILF